MKKFFKNLRSKSPAKGRPQGASPQLGAQSNLLALRSIGYNIKEKELGKLHKAVWTGDIAKVKQLAKKDPCPLDKENRTPLHLACAKGNAEIVQLLVEWRAKLNVGDNQAKTPLMKAVECGHKDCVDCLLSERPELNVKDEEGNTCLHMVARDGNLDILRLLIKKDIDLNVKNKHGLSPLHLAVMGKHEAVCQMLLKQGALVDIADEHNRTPLMKACEDGSRDLVQLLLSFKADTEVEDEKHWKADDWAMIKGHHVCSQLIADYNHIHNRTSASSTPRLSSVPSSLSGTPRDKDAPLLGAPAVDAEEDDSPEETSKISAVGAAACNDDSWGDDTDISLAQDDKSKQAGFPRIDLSKLVKNISDSDASESAATPKAAKFPRVDEEEEDRMGTSVKKHDSTKSLHSQTSVEDDWSLQDDLSSPKRNPSRVQFKKDEELSQIHNFSMQSEDDQHSADLSKTSKPSVSSQYVPSGLAGSTGLSALSPEKQRAQKQKNAFLEDLGIIDHDENSDADLSSEMSGADLAKVESAEPVRPSSCSGHDSEWDSTVPSDQKGHSRPGILKNWSKESCESDILVKEKQYVPSPDEASDWDTSSNIAEVASKEDNPPALPTSPIPKIQQHFDDWNNDLEVAVFPLNSSPVVSKEVEALLRLRQLESQDTEDECDDDEFLEKNKEIPMTSELLQTTIEQSAKHFMDMDSSLDIIPCQKPEDTVFDILDVTAKEPHQLDQQNTANGHYKNNGLDKESKQQSDEDDSDWDSDGDLSEKIPPGKGFKQTDVSHHKPAADSDVEAESESISEWEIERQKQKELQKTAKERDEVMKVNVQILLNDNAHNSSNNKTEANQVVCQKDKQYHDFVEEETESDKIKFEESIEDTEIEERNNDKDKGNKASESDQLKNLQQQENEGETQRIKHEEANRCEQEVLNKERQCEEEEDKRKILKAEAEKELKVPTLEFSQTEELTEKNIEEFESQRENKQMSYDDFVDAGSGCNLSTSGDKEKRSEEQGKQEKLPATTDVEKQGQPLPVSIVEIQNKSSLQFSMVTPPSSFPLPFSTSTSHQLRQRLQVPPPSQTAIQNADFDDDDSSASDICVPDSPCIERHDVTATYPGLLNTGSFRFDALEDDGLSYTSTEFEKDDSILGGPPPSVLQNRDMLINLNLNDSSSLLKIQNRICETEYELEQERKQRLILENKHKMITKERNDLKLKIESLMKQKSYLEETKLNLEAQIRNLEYNLMEQKEKSKNAEVLLDKTKEHLARKEELYTLEIESRQKAELSLRNAELESKSACNKIKELENILNEMKHEIKFLKDTRDLQRREELQYQDEMKEFTDVKTNTVEEGNEDSQAQNFKVEAYQLKLELHKLRKCFQEENSLLTAENEELRRKFEEISGQIALHEDALTKAASNYSIQLNKLKSEKKVIEEALEKEKASKEKMETKLESTINLLNSTVLQMQEANMARNEIEKELQQEKCRYQNNIEEKCNENAQLKNNNQQLAEMLKTSEIKMNKLENEINISQTSLFERTNQLQQIKQELDRMKSLLDDTNKTHMEMNAKQQSKIESLQERLSQIQHENITLNQQIEALKNAVSHDANNEIHEKYNNMIMSLRAESEQAKAVVEERNAKMMQTVTQLQEKLRYSENQRCTVESDLKTLNQHHGDLILKMSNTETALHLAQKNAEQLQAEQKQLQIQIQELQKKYNDARDKWLEEHTRVGELVQRVEAAEKTSLCNTEHLANTSANMQAFTKSKENNEEIRQRLEVENARLITELKHQKERADMLFQDLQDSQKVRSSLEALCSNLKTTSAHMEEKLGEETAKRAAYEQEAQESKGMWENEIMSLSKIGLRIAQLEKEKLECCTQLNEEKRKSRKICDVKKNFESKVEAEKQKNEQLQTEISNLKMQLKTMKKKQKEQDGFDPHPTSTHYSECDRQRNSLEGTFNSSERQTDFIVGNNRLPSSDVELLIRQELEAKFRMELNRKLNEVNRYLEEQAHTSDQLNNSRAENERRLLNEKNRLQKELTEMNAKYQKTITEYTTLEIQMSRYKKLYETEMKWRMRLSQQLELTYSKAVDYRTKMSHQSKLCSSLNFSSLNNGVSLDASKHFDSANGDFNGRIQAELDRSIAKHLEAAPHDDINPHIHSTTGWNSSCVKASAEYSDLLKRKYCL